MSTPMAFPPTPGANVFLNSLSANRRARGATVIITQSRLPAQEGLGSRMAGRETPPPARRGSGGPVRATRGARIWILGAVCRHWPAPAGGLRGAWAAMGNARSRRLAGPPCAAGAARGENAGTRPPDRRPAWAGKHAEAATLSVAYILNKAGDICMGRQARRGRHAPPCAIANPCKWENSGSSRRNPNIAPRVPARRRATLSQDLWGEFWWWVNSTAVPCLTAVMLVHLARIWRRDRKG